MLERAEIELQALSVREKLKTAIPASAVAGAVFIGTFSLVTLDVENDSKFNEKIESCVEDLRATTELPTCISELGMLSLTSSYDEIQYDGEKYYVSHFSSKEAFSDQLLSEKRVIVTDTFTKSVGSGFLGAVAGVVAFLGIPPLKRVIKRKAT